MFRNHNYSVLWVLYNSVTPEIVCALLMTANKPETAVQGCAFFLWSHTLFFIMYCPIYACILGSWITEGSARLCVVWGISVPLSSRRRTLYPPVVANEEARADARCISPCVCVQAMKLERANRHRSATVSQRNLIGTSRLCRYAARHY